MRLSAGLIFSIPIMFGLLSQCTITPQTNAPQTIINQTQTTDSTGSQPPGF